MPAEVEGALAGVLQQAYRGRRVFVTGHTGFKGAWLCEWLLSLGAEVRGFSLPPPTVPSLFVQLGLRGRVDHVEGDVRDAAALARAMTGWEPDYVFHLAAQPIVRESYREPRSTWETNVMGTVHALEAIRDLMAQEGAAVAAVLVTTDKCYDNREWVHAYREEDPVGGHDPYAASKAAAELAIAAWRASYFGPADSPAGIASARAGNVVGGGDWAPDRIVPDAVRALSQGRPVGVRNPAATRPWQHVLEPLGGYLLLAAAMAGRAPVAGDPAALRSAFNFGPPLESNRSVRELVEQLLAEWPGRWEDRSEPGAPHEARLLNLATDKAWHLLAWRPRWDFRTTVRRVADWYLEARGLGEDAAAFQALTRRQILAYTGAST